MKPAAVAPNSTEDRELWTAFGRIGGNKEQESDRPTLKPAMEVGIDEAKRGDPWIEDTRHPRIACWYLTHHRRSCGALAESA